MIWTLVVIGSFVFAEIYGYFLHILLHSYIFPSLSVGHMNHHILSYPSGKKMRHREYIQETNGGRLIFGLGLEWLVPSIILLLITVAIELFIGLSFAQIVTSISILLFYSIFLFWFLHETLHIKGHKILKIKFFKKWYLHARKMHDIHHHYINETGLMNKNYGIAFFWLDRVFGTYLPTMRGGYNKDGARLAKERLKRHANL